MKKFRIRQMEQVKNRVQDAAFAISRYQGLQQAEDEYDNAVLEAIDFLLHIEGMSHEKASEIVDEWVEETEGGWPFVV